VTVFVSTKTSEPLTTLNKDIVGYVDKVGTEMVPEIEPRDTWFVVFAA
jgi:hypothetical protein